MKVFFSNSFLETCHYVRCMMPMRAAGWDGDKTSLRRQRISTDQQARAVLDADVVVFHRPNDDRSLDIAKALKKQGKKIVMDNDDTYKETDTRKFKDLLSKVDHWVDEFGKFADLITCSTEFLAEEYRKLNPNVVVLPNCIDPDDWPEEPQRTYDPLAPVRIGFVGSVAMNGDFEPMKDVLLALTRRNDVRVVLFALPPRREDTALAQKYYKEDYEFWETLNVEWQPFVTRADYVETLDNLKLDIMVIPRRDDYFNRCKSNLKFLEASMLEIPVIAQGFPDGKSPYEVNPDDARHMIIVTGNGWEKAINFALEHPQAMKEAGKKAKQYVLENYDINKHITKWEEAYAKLLAK
jgi:glycosyltransferase involved in cell wall biosynthesis